MTTHTTGSHEGTVTSLEGNKMTTKCSKGDTHNITIAKDAKVTCDGKAATASDVKVGASVQVTTHKDDATIATAVSCTSGKAAQQGQQGNRSNQDTQAAPGTQGKPANANTPGQQNSPKAN